MRQLVIKIFVVITYIGMIVVNALANALPINNVTTGQVSDSYPNLFAPTGLTFSIWGIIYLLLGAYMIYQLGIFNKINFKKEKEMFEKIGSYFILSSTLNILWIFAWHHYYIGLSVIFMLGILLSLIKIANILRKTRFSTTEYVFIKLPFSVYFGWITVATIANIVVYLVSVNWDGFGLPDAWWMIFILIVGALIGIFRSVKDKDLAYILVFVWAYLGILIKHISKNGFDGNYPEVIISIIICIILFLVTVGIHISKKYKKIK